MHAVQPVHSPVRTTSSYRSRHCVLSAVEAIRGASIGGAIRRPQSLVVPPSVTLDRQREKERSMRSMTWIRLVAVVFSLSLILAACGGDDEGNGGATGATDVTVTNEDSTPHTFTLEDESVDLELAGGESGTATIDVTESTGFFCRIHPNMTGTVA